MTAKELCGCKHDGHRWLVQCEKHAAEHKALHEQAARDYHRGQDQRDTDALLNS